MFPFDTPSDVTLVIDFVLAVALLLYFSLGKPRTWVHDRLGWVIFSYALVTVAFIGLIAYAIVFGQKVVEPIRFLVGAGMGVALALKIFAVYRERRAGRLAKASLAPTERKTMSTEPNPTISEIAEATNIWYKSKRVLRTAFSTLLTILPLAPQVIAIVQGQWDAAWLTPIAIQAVAINAALSRIMAIPVVNAWLTKIGLGVVPQKALVIDPIANAAFVMEDPKANQH